MPTTPTRETEAVILGHELLVLLDSLGGEADLERLRGEIARAFGPSPVFGNCHGDRFDVEGLIAFFVARGKLSREGDRVRLGPVPGCEH